MPGRLQGVLPLTGAGIRQTAGAALPAHPTGTLFAVWQGQGGLGSMAVDSRGRRTGPKRFWQNYNLSIILFALFLVSWGLQTWAGWLKFSANQEEHQQVAELFGPSGYVFEWLAAIMENWQSEFLQLLTFVIPTASFIHKGSHESKDSDEELKAMVRRIEERLARIKS